MAGERFFSEESLKSRISVAEDAVNVLEKLTTIAEDELLSNFINMYAIKGAFLIFLQAILDIANYIIAEREFGVPTSYENLLDILIDYKIIDSERRDDMEKLLKIREKILHSSEIMSSKLLIKTIKENLSFFKELLNILRTELFR